MLAKTNLCVNAQNKIFPENFPVAPCIFVYEAVYTGYFGQNGMDFADIL
jgi:hypothetical protein